MASRTMYKVHKWIAASVGAFFLLWLVSGIIMVLPSVFPSSAPRRTPGPLDFREISVSPADAVATLAKVLRQSPQAYSVNLTRIANAVVYEIRVAPASSHLIDARSGQLFTITPEIAEWIVSHHAPSQGDVLENDLVARHTIAYPWGSLPAYRIVLANDRSTTYYVSTWDGSVQRSDRWSRIQAAIASLHTFEPLKLITKRDGVRKGLLILLSAIGIGAAGTGYYLALPRRWK